MSKVILILSFVFAVTSCGQVDQKGSGKSTTPSINSLGSGSYPKANWYVELLNNYIKKSESDLIKSSRQDQAIKIEWLLDRVEDADSAKYYIFHIGHDVVDEGNTNPRFVTDGWVYIDSLTKTLYEYDLPNDKLIKWEK